MNIGAGLRALGSPRERHIGNAPFVQQLLDGPDVPIRVQKERTGEDEPRIPF